MRKRLASVLFAAAVLSASALAQRPEPIEPRAQVVSRSASALASSDSATQAAIKAIDACLPRLDPQIDVGYERIAARCPDLARRLRQSTLGAWLPRSWQDPGNNLSAGSLAELRVLAVRELNAASAGTAPSVERLRAVLTEIGHAARERPTLWSRFKVWLRRVMANREAQQDAGWFTRAIGRVGLPQTVIELVTYVALAAVIGLAALILVNELRAAAGVWRGRVRLSARKVYDDVPQTMPLTRESLEGAPPAEKIRLLFELITTWLMRTKLLPPARSLTHRELTRAAKLEDAEDRRRLQELARFAEAVRYRPGAASTEELNTAFDSGRVLLDRLETGVVFTTEARKP
jgi:hypothetical protein